MPKRNPARPVSALPVAKRREQVLAMREAGASLRQVAKALGIATDTAWRDEQHELGLLAARTSEHTEAYRKLHEARLDSYLLKLKPAIDAGNQGAIKLALAISESHRRLLGLDAPLKVDWRAQAERDGVDPDAVLDEVKQRLRAAVAGGLLGGSADGGPAGDAPGRL